MDWQGITALAAAAGVLLNYILQYLGIGRDKLIEYRIEKMRTADAAAAAARRKKEKNDSHNVYGEIWALLHTLQASRVYIIQPHPVTHAAFISVIYESRDSGITPMRDVFHELPVGDVAGFVTELRTRDFVYWHTLDDIKDDRARALLHNAGANTMVIKRLMDGDDWVGSLVIDFAQPCEVAIPYTKGLMAEAANSIQYILPEYQ